MNAYNVPTQKNKISTNVGHVSRQTQMSLT